MCSFISFLFMHVQTRIATSGGVQDDSLPGDRIASCHVKLHSPLSAKTWPRCGFVSGQSEDQAFTLAHLFSSEGGICRVSFCVRPPFGFKIMGRSCRQLHRGRIKDGIIRRLVFHYREDASYSLSTAIMTTADVLEECNTPRYPGFTDPCVSLV